MAAGEQTVPCWRAYGRTRMSVVKRHAVGGKGINTWCFDFPKLGIEALDITISKVIAHDKYNIRSRRRLLKKFTNSRTIRITIEPADVIEELVTPDDGVDTASL